MIEKTKCQYGHDCKNDAKYYSEYLEVYLCGECLGGGVSDYADNG